MSDAAAPAPAKNVTKPSKAAKPAEHPKYIVMVAAAIGSLKERGGSSRQAILKYVMANYNVGNDCEVAKINARVKTALKSGLTAGKLNQAKGTGATGSFRIAGEKKEAAKTKPKKVMKPTAAVTKKPESPKKVAVKKLEYPTNKAAAVKPKKVKTPKKAATAKPKKVTTPKKAAVAKPKSPAKKAAKPKTQKKAAVSEKPAAKKAAKQ
ncbi:histone H1-like [Littorina saxatilis]|uniref:H15 domain-containing protein n=1 Tax=Littorina saxatilis TaxID=31220 RepID=A0AAN9GDX3_9CAEN